MPDIDNNATPEENPSHDEDILEEALEQNGDSSTTPETAVETDEPVEDDKGQPSREYISKPQNVKPEFEVSIKIKDSEKNEGDILIVLPPAVKEYIYAKLGATPNTPLDDAVGSSKWANALQTSMNYVPISQVYQSTLEQEDAEWHQSIDVNGKPLFANSPNLTNVSGEALSGERGTLRFMKFTGLGTVFTVPLWHTGIWLTLKTPSEARLLELYREIMMDKIGLGRANYGLALSALVYVYSERVVKMALEQMYSTNLKGYDDLLDVISCHDVPTIIWGMACAIWNNGFQYERPCSHNPEKCNYVATERLDVSKLLWVNKNAFTPWQLNLMTRKKSGSVTMEEVARYKSELVHSQERRISIKAANGSEFFMDLNIPTAKQYFEYSNDWANSVVSSVEQSLQSEPSETDRNTFIAETARASIMRQYAHWVSSIIFDDNTISDKPTIESILENLSADDEVRTQYSTQVRKYINDTAVSVIGIPSYKCPNCHGEQKYEPRNESLYSIIPLDIVNTFFYLHVQKTRSIRSRLTL